MGPGAQIRDSGAAQWGEKLPVPEPEKLSPEHKVVLLVVIGYRRKGGVSKARVAEILSLDPSLYLDDLWHQELIYADPGRELN